jgi:hypothetical protein
MVYITRGQERDWPEAVTTPACNSRRPVPQSKAVDGTMSYMVAVGAVLSMYFVATGSYFGL